MNRTRIYALSMRQYYLIRDNPVRLVQIFGWVLFDIILWGFLSRYLSGLVGGETQFTPLFLGAVLVWYFTTRTMHGVATAFFEDVWSRNFLNVFASPVKIGEYIASLILVGMATSVMGLVFMVAVARVFFGFSIFMYGFYLVPLLLTLFFSGIALGILGVAIVLRFGPSAEWFIWPIPEMLSPLIGVFYPLAVLPLWLQYFARLLPPSYIFDGTRAIVAGTPIATGAVTFAVVLSLCYVAFAYLFFRSVYRRAVKTGLIARYSAESVT